MASTALPHTTHSQETLQRMEQYMAAAASAPSPDEDEERHQHSPPVSNANSEAATMAAANPDYPPYVRNMMNNSQGPPPVPSLAPAPPTPSDPYQYNETSVTSGSNSGEEDDRMDSLGNSNKRLGGHLNGFSSKKRRKQSKPIRLGPDHPVDGPDHGGPEQPSQSGQDQGRGDVEEEEGLVNSTTPELEDGERRPGLLPMDLPLNLSAAAGAMAAHPTLRVLGAELLQNPDKIPTSAAASLYQNMLGNMPNFVGIPQFPFPFPTSRPPNSASSGTTPVTSGGRIQIFNPEAYCELCNKEFCNKYFLKTHKANKHGIYSEGIPMSGSPPTSSSPNNGGLHPGGLEAGERPRLEGPSQASSHGGGGGPPTPSSQAGSPFSGAFIAANMGALRPPFVPLSPGASPSPKDQANSTTPGRQGDPQALRDAPSRDSTTGANSDSPGALRGPGGGGGPHPMMSPRDLAIPDFRQDVEERSRLMQRDSSGLPKENGELRKSLESPQRGTPVSAGGGAGPPPIPGLPPHLNFNPLMFGGLPSLESLRKEDLEAAAAAVGIPKRPPIPNIPNVPSVSLASGGGGFCPPGVSSGSMPKGPFTPEKLRQMGVINADAFCEICCKEFCNKYFLRVHKLKKHGICSPDLPPEKVQKILNQMAKEAGKTGNPPPPIVRPPMTSAGGLPFGGSGGAGSPDKRSPLPLGPAGLPLRPPVGLMSLPPLEPLLPHALKDYKPQNSMPPPNFDNGPPHFRHPSKEQQEVIRINDDSEDGGILRRPPSRQDNEDGEHGGRDHHHSSSNEHSNGGHEDDMGPPHGSGLGGGGPPSGQAQGEPTAPSEDLQRLQSMIMELNNSKAKSTLMPGGIMNMAPQPPKDPSEAGSGGIRSSEADTSLPTSSNTVCKVCNKDMENKYFLRAHMMNEHGVLHTEEPQQEDGKQQQQQRGGMEDNEGRMPPLINGLDMANAQDFAAKFLQQMQKGLGAAAGLPPLDGDDRNFLERVKNELANAGQGMPGHPMGSPSPTGLAKKLGQLGQPGGQQGDKDPNRKPASLSRSYCDICKKELCNKYFMKTHMLKMHGINIEATNSAGVNCHICKKELCSKYFLKVHMQNSHGLMEDGSPLPPHMKENGSGLFTGMFPPLGAPPPELLGLSPGNNGGPPTSGVGSPSSAEKELYFSRLLGEQSEMSREKIERQKLLMQNRVGAEGSNRGPISGHTCSLCGEDFPEIVALQVHIIKSHGAFPPDSNLFGTLEANKGVGPGSPAHSINASMRPQLPTSVGEAGEGSPINSQANSEEQGACGSSSGKKADDGRSEGELTPNKAPSTPALILGGAGASNPGTPTGGSSSEGQQSSMMSKQFPHIEMLQRHMLSQQFPGLINPLLSGFPGFPGGPVPPFGLPNPLQQLLAGQKPPPGGAHGDHLAGDKSSRNQDGVEAGGQHHQPGSTGNGTKKRRFKCSKCQLKFKKREECLRHIHSSHKGTLTARPSFSANRRLQFSPSKARNRGVRSHYVKRLMEILKVPTSRGTPSKVNSNHIMQAFLIKKQNEPRSLCDLEDSAAATQDKISASSMDEDDMETTFVPSMVYLPVAKKINQPLTVAFSLTPA